MPPRRETPAITVPPGLRASLGKADGGAQRPWLDALPALAAETLANRQLTLTGPSMHGAASLVLPVTTPDGTPAALKLQPVTDENEGEALGLRTWNGDGAVRVLDDDPATGILLLERLDEHRPLSAVPDPDEALRILTELLARLSAVPAPPGLRALAGIAAALAERAPAAAEQLTDPAERALLRSCAAATADALTEPGDRLLHWDLHYGNVLAAEREPWLAIDPKPLAGDPGFELLPALHNRWDEIESTGNPLRAVRRRFDMMTEILRLDRARATAWTLARVLQNCLWDVEDGETRLSPIQISCARALLEHPSGQSL